MKVINAFILEDEKRSQELLTVLLNRYCPQVKVLGHADSLQGALSWLSQNKVELVFLDIHLPDGSGFDLLHLLPKVDFDVIFTTAYEEFAIRAIRKSALDYLVKPLDVDDLQAAIQRLLQRCGNEETKPNLGGFHPDSEAGTNAQQIGLPSKRGVEFYPINEIVRCEADGSYAQVFLNSGKQVLVSRNLKDLESNLDEQLFIRCHRKHLVNKQFVKEYVRGNGGYLVMLDGSVASVSKRLKGALTRKLKI